MLILKSSFPTKCHLYRLHTKGKKNEVNNPYNNPYILHSWATYPPHCCGGIRREDRGYEVKFGAETGPHDVAYLLTHTSPTLFIYVFSKLAYK